MILSGHMTTISIYANTQIQPVEKFTPQQRTTPKWPETGQCNMTV